MLQVNWFSSTTVNYASEFIHPLLMGIAFSNNPNNLNYLFSVEATTLNERTYMLRPQDKFLQDNISRDDILVVSIGGNDVALAPTPCTICSVIGILCLPMLCVEKGITCGSLPVRLSSNARFLRLLFLIRLSFLVHFVG